MTSTTGVRNRFSINTVKGVFNCRGCQARGHLIDFVRFVDGCDFNTACETLTGGGRPAEPQGCVASAPVSGEQADHEARTRGAALWREAIPIAGTLAQLYLRGRGLELPDGASRVLRFHAACPFGPGVRPI